VKGLTHWTKKIDNLTNKGQSVEVKAIRDLISRRIPLIAVVHIHRDYLPSAQSIYLGKAPISETELSTHAAVIVGEYEAVEGNAFGLKPDMYLKKIEFKGSPLLYHVMRLFLNLIL
jgi:hypothetical protein